MAGFGVRVRPSGYQSYVYHDNRTGRSTRYTLGPTGLMSVEGARRKCHEVVLEASPDGIRKNTDEERVPLFRDFVAGEWKTARYDRYKPSTRPPTASALNGQLLPVFGALALDRITRTAVTKWFDEYSQSSPGGANWTLALLQRIVNHALGCGHVRSNPARGIKKNPRPKMTRFLSREEIRRLHEVLDRCVAQRPSRRQPADIIRLLLLTGCRRGEIVNLQWKEVKADVLNLVDAKTGPRRVYLNAQAQAIIERQPRCGSDYILSLAPCSLPAGVEEYETLVPRQKGGRNRGCAPARSETFPCQSGRPPGRPFASGIEAARSQTSVDDVALRTCCRPGGRGGGGADRKHHRQGLWPISLIT